MQPHRTLMAVVSGDSPSLLRRPYPSQLFERGYQIHKVAQFTLPIMERASQATSGAQSMHPPEFVLAHLPCLDPTTLHKNAEN